MDITYIWGKSEVGKTLYFHYVDMQYQSGKDLHMNTNWHTIMRWTDDSSVSFCLLCFPVLLKT